METSIPVCRRERLRLKNPPIVEAVLALYVAHLPDSIIESFRGYADELSSAGYSQLDPQPSMRSGLGSREVCHPSTARTLCMA